MLNWDKRSAPRASRGQVLIQVRGGDLTEYTDIGCLVGDTNLNRAWANNATEDENWCLLANGGVTLAQAAPGNITGTSSLTIEAILSDEAYQFLHGIGKNTFDIRFTLEDGHTPPSVQTLEYEVAKTSDGLNMRGGAGQTTQFQLDIQINEIISETLEVSAPLRILGVSWNKQANPTLQRTHGAVGLTAAVGLDAATVINDFDSQPIFGEMQPVTDALGNRFIRIPKFYIRKRDTENRKSWEVSKTQHNGFYLPKCFYDFTNDEELPFVDVGAHLAGLGTDGIDEWLTSEPGVHPLVNRSIVDFRTLAQANNTSGLSGYQQLDVHVVDVLRTLMFVEFGTLNMQSVMAGWTAGRRSASDTIVEAETGTNRAIVSPATAAFYAVGQPFAIGTSSGDQSITDGARVITDIAAEGANTAITFDGDPVNTSVGHVVTNAAWPTGFSSGIAASSGGIGDLQNGLFPIAYRGVESPFGDAYQWVDGVNINEYQAWVTDDAEDYASNLFAAPYSALSYVNNSGSSGYITQTGFDPDQPHAEFAVTLGGSASTFYADQQHNAVSQRVARFGGDWLAGAPAGVSLWSLTLTSSNAFASAGARLLKKPL